DGFTWRRVSSPTSTPLFYVWSAGPNDTWITNWNAGVWHWNGTSWQAASLPAPATDVFGSISGSSSTDVWLSGGRHSLYHWDGNIWREENLGAQTPDSL